MGLLFSGKVGTQLSRKSYRYSTFICASYC